MIVNKETMRRRFNPLASCTVWDDKLYGLSGTAVRDEGDDLSLDIGNTIRMRQCNSPKTIGNNERF